MKKRKRKRKQRKMLCPHQYDPLRIFSLDLLDNFYHLPTTTAAAAADRLHIPMDFSGASGADLHLALLNLSNARSRMDYVHHFLSDSVNTNTLIGKEQMEMVSKEITAAIRQVIVNGGSLISCSEQSAAPKPNYPLASPGLTFTRTKMAESDLNFNKSVDVGLGLPTVMESDELTRDDSDIVEIDAVELLAEHLHFCDFCGKGFKRDANLRMHMRAHGNKFKTLEALSKPEKSGPSSELNRGGRTRFSCPFAGCNRNKLHKKFRPLKSVICVKNHFKRSHCPKMYSCDRCHKKSFSVLADLKSHLKHCGETKWKCSCGTSFSRKDKLFGHMALFEGHMPAVTAEVVVPEDDQKVTEAAATAMGVEDEDDLDNKHVKGMELDQTNFDNRVFDGFLDEFGSIDDFCIQDVLAGSRDGGIDWSL